VEEAAEKTRAVYGPSITPLGLLIAELGVIAKEAPLFVRLNLEACIATFEARNAPEEQTNAHAPLAFDHEAAR